MKARYFSASSSLWSCVISSPMHEASAASKAGRYSGRPMRGSVGSPLLSSMSRTKSQHASLCSEFTQMPRSKSSSTKRPSSPSVEGQPKYVTSLPV